MTKKHPVLPPGHRILVLVDNISDGTKHQKIGNIITTQSTEDFDRERDFQEKGTVVALGPSSYNMPHHGEPWVKVGDRIIYKKYEGQKYFHAPTGDLYRCIADDAVYFIFNEDYKDEDQNV